MLGFYFSKYGPEGVLEVVVVEGLEGDPGLVHGGGGVVFFCPKKEKVTAQLVFIHVRWVDAEVFANVTDMGDVARNGSLAEVFKLDMGGK